MDRLHRIKKGTGKTNNLHAVDFIPVNGRTHKHSGPAFSAADNMYGDGNGSMGIEFGNRQFQRQPLARLNGAAIYS